MTACKPFKKYRRGTNCLLSLLKDERSTLSMSSTSQFTFPTPFLSN